METNGGGMSVLLDFLEKLERASIHYVLSAPTLGYRALMVSATIPGERWEVEFFEDGTFQVEIFNKSSGVLSESQSTAKINGLDDLLEH